MPHPAAAAKNYTFGAFLSEGPGKKIRMADDPSSTTASINPTTGKVDRITAMLWLSVMIFAGVLVVVDKLFPNEGQVFQVIAGLATGFMGALLNRITPPHPASGTPTGTPAGPAVPPNQSTVQK